MSIIHCVYHYPNGIPFDISVTNNHRKHYTLFQVGNPRPNHNLYNSETRKLKEQQNTDHNK